MKLFVDDMRQPPDSGWVVARTYDDAVKAVTDHFQVLQEVSLDHDLGEARTGYDVACCIERLVRDYGWSPRLKVHSANPVGVARIQQVIQAIDRWLLEEAS